MPYHNTTETSHTQAPTFSSLPWPGCAAGEQCPGYRTSRFYALCNFCSGYLAENRDYWKGVRGSWRCHDCCEATQFGRCARLDHYLVRHFFQTPGEDVCGRGPLTKNP